MTPVDNARAERCIAQLLRYFGGDAIALTGSVAIEYHLARAGAASVREHLTDLDFVVRDLAHPPADLAAGFLISHFHRASSGVRKTMLQLVDPIGKLRVDLFPDSGDAIAQARPAVFGSFALLVLDPADIFAHKRQTIERASRSSPVDPKHWNDAVALAALLGRSEPARPASTATTVFATDIEATCTSCEASRTRDMPLSPKSAIFAILGYV